MPVWTTSQQVMKWLFSDLCWEYLSVLVNTLIKLVCNNTKIKSISAGLSLVGKWRCLESPSLLGFRFVSASSEEVVHLWDQRNILGIGSLYTPDLSQLFMGCNQWRSSNLMGVQKRAKSQRSYVDLYFLLHAVLQRFLSPSFPKGESNLCKRPQSVPNRRRTGSALQGDVIYVPLRYPSRIIWQGGL